jgi:hypothetical protein
MTDSEKLARLKEILLVEDRNFALKIFSKIESFETLLNDADLLGEKVNPLINQKIDAFVETIPEKLGPTITKTIKKQIKDSQADVIDALFPIIGKLIKKYIQNEIKQISDKINNQIQDKLSFKKVLRKFKSIFFEISEADLAMSELAKPEVLQVLVIEKDSGLLIETQYKTEATIDQDMISGMLTAIKGFVEDAFTKDQQNLELIQYELYNIYIQNFPKYYFAIVISGMLNTEFKNKLEDLIYESVADHKFESVVNDNNKLNKLIQDLLYV